MSRFDPYQSLGFHCSLTLKAFVADLARRLEGTGVSPAQFRVLAHLMASGPRAQNELCELLSISAPSAVKLIDRMERDGWVAREIDAADRRVKRVVPTERTTAVWDELSVHSRELLEQAYAGIDPLEIDMTKKILARVRRNLGDQGA
ncbi:MAG: MarR family transcriptional regulator [Deltaproteobacteria bacterium]|nr:MarR family transcriptional regulator [Deltaproteobacteria bacterium]NCP01912.1 MarR family transcriptional regulator [Deltaproteobacteria bacterium]